MNKVKCLMFAIIKFKFDNLLNVSVLNYSIGAVCVIVRKSGYLVKDIL